MRKLHNMLQVAQKTPSKTINLIFFFILASIPLFVFLVFSENILQTTLGETLEILKKNPGYTNHDWPEALRLSTEFVKYFYYRMMQLSLFYLLPLHLLELCSALVILHLTKTIYTKETPLTLIEMVSQSKKKAIIKKTLLTSAYILFLSNSFLLGSIWLAINYYVILKFFYYNMALAAIYRAWCIALMVKYLEFSIQWNMSIVISVSEEIHGADAFNLSSHFTRGSERKWVLCMLVFFMWELILRLMCFYSGCNERWWLNVAQANLLCIGNAMKWVVFMIYFYHCKSLVLYMNDVEVGK